MAESNDQLLSSMTEEIRQLSSRLLRPCNIYRVPRIIRQHNKDSFEPQILSIGPYHMNNQILQAMKEQKWLHLQAILARKPNITLSDILQEARQMEQQARQCYSEETDSIDSDTFVEMMVLDGCFILELFLKMKEVVKEGGSFYNTKRVSPLVARDLLLLENQLPFFVLQRLFDLVRLRSTSPLVELVLAFFYRLVPMEKQQSPHNPSNPILHLLHLLHMYLIPGYLFKYSMPKRSWTALTYEPPTPPEAFPSATELERDGIILQTKTPDGSFLDIRLVKGIQWRLKIPFVFIHQSTKSILHNLIALEQCFPQYWSNYFSSYAIFMGGIIRTAEDVSLLRERSILQHVLGSDKEVAALFAQFSKWVTVDFEDDHSYHFILVKQIKDYLRKPDLSLMFQRMMRIYFKEPMSFVALYFTILQTVTGVTQTMIAVLDFIRKSSPSQNA